MEKEELINKIKEQIDAYRTIEKISTNDKQVRSLAHILIINILNILDNDK